MVYQVFLIQVIVVYGDHFIHFISKKSRWF